ncbi:LLM class flavin-dependent oxidoreductase [Pseudonocardia broussonetiae]|uniref:LLM class flavin-dependent oxidoreductase n=1 Tax=Pseudonocardia broussonetiae TaxID=2736640 RepID=A0A6M6JTT5_9PSEU|nr:LLM class flavin-dependent oxidoreductase [Pseudonocardia broussonetiae]
MTIFTAGRGAERFRRAGEIAAQAEAAGFDAVWTTELYNRSATVPLAVLAAATSRVRIGSNIAYGAGRSPLILAAEARDLDELSEGRLVLGLGNGTRGMLENWLSVSGEAPAARMTELVEVLRALWLLHEGPVHHDGRFYRLHLAPTAETPAPFRERLPIWTAGVNAGMVRVAGRVADGLVAHPMTTTAYLDEVVRPELARGAAEVGRDLDAFTVMGIRMCALDDDEEAARRRLAFAIAQYVLARPYDRLMAVHGWTGHQERIRAAARERDGAAMAAAVPDDMIDAIGIACRPADLDARVAAHEADFGHLDLVAPAWGLSPEESEAATREILAALTTEPVTPAAHPEDACPSPS